MLALCLLGLLLVGSPRPTLNRNSTPGARHTALHAPHTALIASYGKLPLSFEANQGQVDGQVKFLARGRGYTLFLTGTEAVLALNQPQRPQRTRREGFLPASAPSASSAVDLRLKLINANPRPEVRGLEELPGKSNYFIGNDPSGWRTNVPTYAKVEYRDVYPGVNLVHYGNGGQLEHDFVVAPGADPSLIRLAVEGADKMELNAQGDVVLRAGNGDVRLRRPVVYQEIDGARQEVVGSFVLGTRRAAFRTPHSQEVGFELGNYDATRPLVIDPVLTYSTYLGGSSGDNAQAVAVDASGAAYVTGTTWGGFPTAGGLHLASGGYTDAFVTKLNATGSAVVYSTYVGGGFWDYGYGIAVDASGAAYVVGYTESGDFPTASPLQATLRGTSEAFVAKLNAAGSALMYSTFLGGNGSDAVNGVAVDASGNAYVTGSTDSSDFPRAGPQQATYGGGNCGGYPCTDAFVAKLNASGSALVYSTYLGGGGSEAGTSIAVDSAGSAYVTGQTSSTNFPTVAPFQPANAGGYDAFVSKLNAAGSALAYSTYLGGTGDDNAYSIAVDSAGSAYITGSTTSTNLPTGKPLQVSNGGGSDAFVSKLSAAGSALVYSTYLGGSGNDYGRGIAVDSSGNAYVTGYTASTNFPAASPLQAAFGGGAYDAFVTMLNAAGAALVHSTYLGGSGADAGNGIAVDSSGNAYVTGYTVSTNFPTASPLQASCAGDADAFIAKISGATVACTYSITPTNQSFPASAGTGTITVTAASGCTWTAASSASWVTITLGAGGSGSGTVGYSVAANTSTSSRTGTLTIAGQTFTVNQAAATTLSPRLTGLHLFTSDSAGNATGGGWYTYVPNDGKYVLGVAQGGLDAPFINGPNRDDASISILLSPGTYTFSIFNTGGSAPPYFGLNLFFDGNGNTPGISVFAATNYSTVLPFPPFFADGGSTFDLAGHAFVPGAGTLTFVNGVTTVTLTSFHWSAPTVYNRDRVSNFVMVPDGASDFVGQFTLQVIGPGNPVPSLTSLSPASATAGSSGFILTVNGNGFVDGSVARWNGQDRTTTFVNMTQLRASIPTADIAVAGTAQVTVFNPAPGGGTSPSLPFAVSPACTYTLSTTSATVGAGAAGGQVTITTASGCTWTAASNASWITITSGSSGNGSGTVGYSVTANTNTSSRTGTLTIAGQTFTISQSGAATCSYAIAPTSASVPAAGTTGSVTVTAASGCTWTAASNASWITIASGSPGSGNGTVVYSVTANTSAGSRAGTVTIAGQTFAVTQTAAATLNISPTALSFTAQRGGANPAVQGLQVTASDASSIPWTATSSAAWLSVSPASGNTPANVSVSVNITGLAAGSYTAQASFASGGSTPATVSVSLNVSETPAVIGASPASLQFTTSAGINPASQNLTVSNLGGGTLSWLATVGYTTTSGWLSISPPGGNAPTTATVSVDVVTPVLPAATYRGQVLVFALSGATNSPLSVPVTLVVTSPSQLAVSPQFLSFQATQGSSAAVTQAISITNSGSGALNWTASATTSNGGDWLRLSATQGAAPAGITVSANPAGLAAGIYLGSIKIADVAGGGSITVIVALTVNPPATTILLSQSDFVFTTVESTPGLLKQTLRILNLGQGTLAWKLLATIPSGGNWLAVDQASGSSTTDPATAAPIGVLVNPVGLAAGNYYGLLIASSAGATNSPQLASVHLRVLPPTSAPMPSVLPSGFIFAAAQGSAGPPAQALSIQNLGGGALPFKASVSTADGSPWLSVSPSQAVGPATMTVQANSANLRAGVYRGSIALDFPAGVSQDLSVVLVITPGGVTASAFGGPEGRMAGCTPTELHAVSTLLPNNFLSLVGWPVPIMVRVVDDCNNAVTGATVVASFLGAEYAPLVLKSLRDGLYSGTWVPLSNKRVRVSIKALNPPLKEAGIELLSQPADFTANLPLINPEGVVNGASFAARTPVAPGSIISLFGRNLVREPAQASTATLPRDLGGLAVKIGDQDAPLFYANNGQVNAQVPLELASNTAASVVLTMNGKVSPPEPLLLSPVQPGVFSYDDGGVARGAVLDEKYRLIGKSNPAAPGAVIQVFATGLGPTDPPAKTGEPAPSNPVAVLDPAIQLTASIGGLPAEIQFKGAAPGFVGLYQVNVKVPSGLPSGDLPLVLTANGLRSNEVMLAVK
jgi:uncharacterized protein (TIGR03437 family)